MYDTVIKAKSEKTTRMTVSVVDVTGADGD